MAVIYLCPTDKRLSCSWEGNAADIKQHFENDHTDLLFHTNSIKINLEELPENKLLFIEGKLFLIQNFLKNEKLAIRLRLLGSNEEASRIKFDLLVTVDKVIHRYDTSPCVLPKEEEWVIDLQCLETYHGKIVSLVCSVILEDTSLKINNSYVEEYACDPSEITENIYLEDIRMVDKKIAELKREEQTHTESILEELRQGAFELEEQLQMNDSPLPDHNRESSDFEDKISQYHFSMLEEEFSISYENSQNENQELSNIPEKVDLSCSTCDSDMLPPIYLCKNNHNVCSRCKIKLCRICNSYITNTRNTELEEISRSHLHQCRYSSEGCSESFKYSELRAHEIKCEFCKYKCLVNNCPFEGRFEHFTNHLKIVHASVKIGVSTKNEFPKNFEMYVVHKSVGIFYCQSELKNDFLTWRATFCGPSERQFFCEITFKGSKFKEPVFLKRKGHVYEIRKPLAELKKNKAKEKYAELHITSYDSSM